MPELSHAAAGCEVGAVGFFTSLLGLKLVGFVRGNEFLFSDGNRLLLAGFNLVATYVPLALFVFYALILDKKKWMLLNICTVIYGSLVTWFLYTYSGSILFFIGVLMFVTAIVVHQSTRRTPDLT